jgi:hypothetical protein
MVLAGRSSRGTEASCLAATDPTCPDNVALIIEDHRQGFCAVVSIAAKSRKPGPEIDAALAADLESFRVEDITIYGPEDIASNKTLRPTSRSRKKTRRAQPARG